MTTRPFIRSHVRSILGAVLAILLLGPLLTVAPPTAMAGQNAAGSVEVRTVPATAGVRLRIAGSVVTTGPGGTARVDVSNLNGVAKRVSLAASQLNPGTVVGLTHVSPDPHTAAHLSRLSLGLTLTSRVRLSVVSDVQTIPARDALGLRLHSITGTVRTVAPGAHVNLLARRAVLRHGVLTSQSVTWSVDHVTTADKAAVTTSSPRFDPAGRNVWTVRLAPVAGSVTVRTVPRVSGVSLGIGNTTLTTGSDGTATVQVPDLNLTRDHLKLLTPEAGTKDRRVVHIAHVGSLPPKAPHERQMIVALTVSRPVTLDFVDPRGTPIPASRVQRIQLNQQGRTITISGPQAHRPLLLTCLEPHQAHGIWHARRIGYTISEVRVDGANTVFAGRQRLDPEQPASWRIRLSVYALTMTVRDALLGRRVTSAIALTWPDGAKQHIHVGSGTPVRTGLLPRGLYQLEVDAAAIGNQYPVLVSQDTHADLRVITRTDLVIIILVLLTIAAALVLTGRHLHTSRRRPRPADEDSP